MAVQSFVLHEIHCQRNFYRCLCGEFLKKSDKVEHEAAAHKSEQCQHCRMTAPAYEMAKHKCQKLPKPCQFCNAVIIFDEFVEHVKVCGSRTQLCPICKKYIQAWKYDSHEATCVPEPVRPPPSQKPNRFIDEERKVKERAQERARQEDSKVSPVRAANPPDRPRAQPTVSAKKPAESIRPSVKLTPTVQAPKPSIPSRQEIASKPGVAGRLAGVKPAVISKPTAVSAPKPTAVSAPRNEQKPGPRTHDTQPLPRKQPTDSGYAPSDDFDFDHMVENEKLPRNPAYVGDDDDIEEGYYEAPATKHSEVEYDDEDIARALAASMQEIPASVPRPKPRVVEDDDEALARAYEESMQDAIPAVANPREREERAVAGRRQPATGTDTMGRYDPDLDRALRESQADDLTADWVLEEDLALNEAIHKSMKEK